MKANDRWNLIERGTCSCTEMVFRSIDQVEYSPLPTRDAFVPEACMPEWKWNFPSVDFEVYMCVDEKVRGGSVESRKAVGGPTEEPGLRSQTCSTAPLESVPIYIYIEPRARLQPVAAVYSISGYICVFPFTPWDTPAYPRHTLPRRIYFHLLKLLNPTKLRTTSLGSP